MRTAGVPGRAVAPAFFAERFDVVARFAVRAAPFFFADFAIEILPRAS
jgi:hypothetical protein